MTYKSVIIWWSTGEKTDFKGNDIPDRIVTDGPFLCFYYKNLQKTVSYLAASIDRMEVREDD